MQLPTSSSSERSTEQTSTPSAAMEYQGVLSDYDTLIVNLNKPDISLADLEGTSIVPHVYSPLARLGSVGRELLKPLLNDLQYRAHCQQSGANPDSLVLTVDDNRVKYELSTVDGKRKLTLGLPAQQLKFATDKNGQPVLVATTPRWANLIVSINQAAIKMGGEIRSDGAIKLVQMITYYGTSPWDPKVAAEHRATIHALEEKRARHSLQLDSGVDIDALSRAPTNNDRKTLKNIRQAMPNSPMTMDSLIAQLTNRDMTDIVGRFLPETETSLLGYLEKNTYPRANAEQVRATPMVFLENILRSAESERLGNALLEGLNWYGGKPGEDASPGVRIKLISKAIRLWTDASRSNEPDDIAGYPWYQRSNWGKSYQSIWAEFEQHLFDSKRASSTTEAILLARLFQAEFPRDFQIPDIPPDLPYRSSAVWVNFVHGVTLAESMEPDLIQRMTFQQLVDFPLQQSVQATPKEQELIGLCRTPPTLEWAITNNIILQRIDSDYSQEEIDRSIKALDEHTDALRKAIIQLDVNYPERSAIAEREMKKYFKDALFIGHEGTPVKPFGPSSFSSFISDGRKLIEDFGHIDGGGLIQAPPLNDKIYSFRDVYMSGRLTKKKNWFITMKDGIRKSKHRISINADRTIKTTAPWLPETLTQNPLPDAEELFESEFNNYLEQSKSAYQTLLKSQFASLPYDDRQAIEQGEVKIYTLRKSTSEIALEDETPTITLPLRLRMGFILQITYKTKASYYECLPRAGIIRRRADFSSAMLNGKKEAQQIKGSLLGNTDVSEVRRGKKVPFDWDAHENGSLPKENATCEAIIDQVGETFTAPSLSPDSEQSSRPTVAFSRASELANFIANNFFYFDEKLLHAAARGLTEIERIAAHPHWLDSVKGFIPFWGSISDLLSGDPKKKTWAIFGVIVDVLSFAFPLGKFVSGSLKLVSTAVRSGVRTALPKFGALSQKLLISSVQNVIPFYGVPTLALRLSQGLLRGLYTGVKFVVKKSFNSLKPSLGRAGKYSFIEGLPQVADPGCWTPLTNGDRLASLRGLEDVPVRNIGSTAKPVHYLIDPVSAKPYGHVLKVSENELSIGPSLYPTVGKNSDSLLFRIPENTRVREVLEVDGRTTFFLDDVPYRLDDNTLRRVGMIDDSDALKLIPCRPRRAPGETTCPISYVNGEPFATPPVGSFDETKGYAPWFGDRISTPGTRPGNEQSFLALDGAVYLGSGDTLKKFDGDLTTLGFTKKWLVPNKNIPATLEFQKGIYGRIMVKGTYEGANDSHKVGAIVGQSFDESTIYVFTRLNTDKYYVATLSKGQSLREPLTLNRLFKKDLADGTVGEELLRVYTGSLSANNIARIHGVEALERAMRTMEEIAIPIGTGATPASNMKWLKIDTSPGEALMFDYSTRMIVSRLPEGATSWTRSKGAPEAFRQRAVEIFDELFLEPTIKLNNVDSALRIDATMKKLHALIPRRQRSRNPRNIAYAEVTTAVGKREVYVSVSGAQGMTGHLPLFKQHPGVDQVKVGETTYFNIDLNRTFPSTSLNVTEEGKLLTVPPTIKDIGTYRPALTSKPKSLDSESKLISAIREKYPDPRAIESVNIATTMPPCESCSVVIKEFGYDGGENALNVLWH